MQNAVAESMVFYESVRQGERTIGEIARSYDVSLRTLRFYEDKGLLQPRRQGTARFYSARERIRLELILKGKRLGFTLAEIYNLIASRSDTAPDSQETDLTESLGQGQIAAQIAHLERQRNDLEIAIGELRRATKQTEPANEADVDGHAEQAVSAPVAIDGRSPNGV